MWVCRTRNWGWPCADHAAVETVRPKQSGGATIQSAGKATARERGENVRETHWIEGGFKLKITDVRLRYVGVNFMLPEIEKNTFSGGSRRS